MIALTTDMDDRFERRGNAVYRPGRIEQVKADGHDLSWAVAYYILAEDDEILYCSFIPHSRKPTIEISKALLV